MRSGPTERSWSRDWAVMTAMMRQIPAIETTGRVFAIQLAGPLSRVTTALAEAVRPRRRKPRRTPPLRTPSLPHHAAGVAAVAPARAKKAGALRARRTAAVRFSPDP